VLAGKRFGPVDYALAEGMAWAIVLETNCESQRSEF
jgi:hypothetical protein